MFARLTGISTPILGASWEYTKEKERPVPLAIIPDQKIKVFISSICGNEKYDSVRLALKDAIEATQLVDVYTFEGKGASTLPAGSHYTFALEDCDICIFLIDNADGIHPGVQNEIDTVKKRNIMALYYFCDEVSKEKTAVEQSLMGAQYAKSKPIHKFEDLSRNGAQDLINDIISIYHYYCKGKITLKEDVDGEFQSIDVTGTEKMQLQTIPKAVLKNVDKCRDYILKFVTEHPYNYFGDKTENTSEIDEWGVQFFPILFEGKSIREFNTGMYLETLKSQQTPEHYEIVCIRWKAIQAYFQGDVTKCVEHLEEALKMAQDSNQPIWVIKDILIDLRNQQLELNAINNCFMESIAQKELTQSGEELYYPILDRINGSLHEKYVDGLYKKKTESPYAVALGNDLVSYGELLASSYIVSLYNGSLTYILLFYDKIKNFLFYLSNKYDDWNFRRDMFKIAIYKGKEKEVRGIQDSYPELLNNLSAEDAERIMLFCNNQPINYKRLISLLVAFGAVGYYLNDADYQKYETIIINEIKEWVNDEKRVILVGEHIFKNLSNVSHRMSQEILADICCMFFNKHFVRWYLEIFRFIAKYIDLNKLNQMSATTLVEHLSSVFENDREREEIKYAPAFLYIFRNQSKSMTEELDQKTAKYFPDFYKDTYSLETTEEENLSCFIENYVKRIKRDNEEQGRNGSYFGHGTRDIAIIRAILVEEKYACDPEIMDEVISAVADTLLMSKEEINIKMDAISLLVCIVLKYPEAYKRNNDIFEKIFKNKDEIDTGNCAIMFTNITDVALKIGLEFLFASMEIDTYANILELMPYIQNDIATTTSVAKIIIEYLEVSETVVLPKRIEGIVLQNVLQWLHSDYLDIRWIATRILIAIIRNPENENIVNRQILNLVDTDNVYIKNLIMRNIYHMKGITDKTKDYVISKCEKDTNFVVRMVCEEETKKYMS